MKEQSPGENHVPNAVAPHPINGVLHDWFETGTEGVIWALIDDDHPDGDYDGLHVIHEGDHLTILSETGQATWQGIIKCDRKIGAIPRPTNPNYIQQAALGCWVHWIQTGFEPDRWAEFFIRGDAAPLRGILIKGKK